MGYPSFTQGEVFKAADANSIGLWLVKTQTVGTGVTSVTVTDAFSATYDNYRITYTGGNLNTLTLIGAYMGAAAAANGYYGGRPIVNLTTAAITGQADNNVGQWTNFGVGSTTYADLVFDVLNPFLARRTHIVSPYFELNPGGNSFMGTYVGILNDTNSYTSITLDPFGGNTMSGGTIRVYGMRN